MRKQVAREEPGLVAAGTGTDLDDRVSQVIVGVLGDERALDLLGFASRRSPVGSSGNCISARSRSSASLLPSARILLRLVDLLRGTGL